MTDASLYRLMTWLSPAYPIGAYSYSHGIEYAVEAGLVTDRATLVDWVGTIVTQGAGRIDGAVFAAAWRATAAGDDARLADIVALAKAWRGTAETALESAAQGAAFLVATRAAWPHAALERIGRDVTLAVAVGATAAAHGIALERALLAYLQSFVANLVSAGVRLIPLGQTDGQRALAALEDIVTAATSAALDADLDTLGAAAPMADWCSMRHETQYTRLFRS
jgi:urease accessory protein